MNEPDRTETPADRAWIMAQFREPWKPIALDTLTVLRWAAFGAGYAVTLYLLTHCAGCAAIEEAQIRKQIEEAHSTPWPEAMLESLAYPK